MGNRRCLPLRQRPRKARAAERAGTAFIRNAEALRGVQPDDVLPGDIDANLGAPWIPERDMQAFAAELFRVDSSSVPVAHFRKDASGAWKRTTPLASP